ncbi:oxidoreductase [Nocardia terpenica]|uniref:Oxidoreductase n=1 Tax=Nocardia terpenica TaxID=455432 RepID=A0A164IE58_9NOCA|nr:oxidoreductase [Nocardia terpenica]KZM69354.1 oxidoreductase [Nocardia terpenica]NQE88348.1 oxidoreductase [Nocardia terpenica]
MTDVLQPLVDLPGVRDAADRARDALAEVHRHRANRRGWPTTAAEAAVRAARSSAAIDGGSTDLSAVFDAASAGPSVVTQAAASGPVAPAGGRVADPILAGALRVGQALDGDALRTLTGVWQRAPLQALARLHLLAAADLVADEQQLGRPRTAPGVAERLDLLTQTVLTSAAPAPVLAAVVHGELLALRPFGTADGIVARAASRLVAVSSGLDPHSLGVPEVFWLRRRQAYQDAAAAFGAGTPEGVGGWVMLCCGALEDGAREAHSIADSAAG